jgi:hypothetical protein
VTLEDSTATQTTDKQSAQMNTTYYRHTISREVFAVTAKSHEASCAAAMAHFRDGNFMAFLTVYL